VEIKIVILSPILPIIAMLIFSVLCFR
jgi:hypothetical protein